MKSKKIIYIVYPKTLESVSMNKLAMSELLLNELIFSKKDCIKFHVNNKSRLIECNDSKVKGILDLLLKSGKLPDVKAQILELLHKEERPDKTLGELKVLVGNEQACLVIKEIKTGVDFTWEVNRVPNNCKKG